LNSLLVCKPSNVQTRRNSTSSFPSLGHVIITQNSRRRECGFTIKWMCRVAERVEGRHAENVGSRRYSRRTYLKLISVLNSTMQIRCDAQQQQPQRCTRCKKMGLDCIILPTSAKSSRRTKAELQRELDSLKTEVQKQAQTFVSPPGDIHPRNVTSPRSHTVSPESVQLEASPGPLDAANTLPRTLNGLFVEANRIDDCFAL
jgi:hypothetical protein